MPHRHSCAGDDPYQQDAFEEFAPRIREILREYRDQRRFAAISRRLGFHQSRLTEMITQNGDGDYKTRITPYYLAKFIESGIMTIDQILQGRELKTLPERARIFFERMSMSRRTLRLITEAQRRGIDLNLILENILYPKSTG